MASKTTKIVPGETTFHATFADGRPKWLVTRSRGRDVWEAKAVESPDYEGTVKVFTTAEIQQAHGWESFFAKNAKSQDSFYAALPLGGIVHYDNGFENWVRCEVVMGSTVHNEKPHKCLKPIALVGNWSKHDLPHRSRDGEVRMSYHAQKIASGECFEPNFGSVYESGRSAAGRAKQNPLTLKAFDLTVPEMTPEEVAAAKLWKTVATARKVLETEGTDNPVVRLREAMSLIKTALNETV